MTSETHRRAFELFDAVCDLPPSERELLLDRECGDGAELRAIVDRMLRHDNKGAGADGEMRPGVGAEIVAAEVIAEDEGVAPAQIGQYRIVRQIARGGMGAVYEAEQDNPRRRVALKMIRSGLASPQLIKRFQQEAHVLGFLQHPGIAHIYEAGSAIDNGVRRPFLAMEYIDGKPLGAYADHHNLDVRQRLELVARVCDAVQHAHQKGIIHRDLKPANILVVQGGTTHEGDSHASLSGGMYTDIIGQPKVLDFGIARVTESDLKLVTLQTEVAQLVGTLSYMSPEQVAGGSVELDRRSDVYALGVIGHELLVGEPPHDIRNHTIPEAARIIQDEEPSRLSLHNSMYRGDIETIIATALEKDRERRYESAAEMASDIRRFLRDEPIQARPTSTFYQLRKFARRNRTLVGGVAATLVSLVIGIVGVTWLALREADARHEAQRSAYVASLAASAAALREQDVATAERRLLAAPVELRGWGWNHLHSRLDGSLASEPIAGDPSSLGNDDFMRGRVSTWFAESDGVVCVARHRYRDATLEVETRDAATLKARTSWSQDMVTAFAPLIGGGALLVHENSGAATRGVSNGEILRQVSPLTNPARLSFKRPIPASLLDGSARRVYEEYEADLPSETTLTFGRERLLLAGRPNLLVRTPSDPSAEIRLEQHHEGISDAVFDQDERFLFTGGNDRSLACFDLNDGGRRMWQRIDAHRDAILAVALSPDGALLATGGQDCVLRLWDARTGAERGELVGHREPILAIAFNAAGNRIATCSAIQVKLWDVDTAGLNVLGSHPSFVKSVAVSPDGSVLASGGEELRIWDVASGTLVCEWRPFDIGRLVKLSFSADGQRLAATSGSRSPVMIDIRTGRSLDHHFTPLHGMAQLSFGPAGQTLIVGGAQQPLILNANTYKQLATLPASEQFSFAFDRHGRRVAYVRRPAQSVAVYDLDTQTRLRDWTRSVAGPTCFLDDGATLAVALEDRSIVLLDVASGRELGVLHGHTSRIFDLARIPNRRRLISAGEDRTIRLWDLDTMEETTELRGHTDSIRTVAVPPNGKTIFSASDDYTIRRWDARPPSDILMARMEYRKIAARLTPYVAALFAQLADATAVADSVEADETLNVRERQIARQLVLKESIARARLDPVTNATKASQ